MTDEISQQRIRFKVMLEAKDGDAEPSEIREVLQQFCDKFPQTALPPAELEYVIFAIRRFLDSEEMTLEDAFGFSKGKPHRPEGQFSDRNENLAHQILELRLEGSSHEEARAQVAERNHISESSLNNIWRDNSQNALMLARRERLPASWTAEEFASLHRIYKNASWFSAGK